MAHALAQSQLAAEEEGEGEVGEVNPCIYYLCNYVTKFELSDLLYSKSSSRRNRYLCISFTLLNFNIETFISQQYITSRTSLSCHLSYPYNHHLNPPVFLNVTQEEEAKGHSHFGSSLAIPSVVWKADGALLAGAPWSRGRAALFVEVRCAFSELDDTCYNLFLLRLYMRFLRRVILTVYL